MSNILLVEQDKNLATRIAKWLTLERHAVTTVSHSLKALRVLVDIDFDLLILTWDADDFNVELARSFRTNAEHKPIFY